MSSEYTSGSSGSTSGGASESGSYSESDRSSHSYASQSSSSLSPSDSRGGSEPGSEADDLQGDEVEKLLPSMGNIGMDSEGVENLCYGAQVRDIGIPMNDDNLDFLTLRCAPYFVFYSWLEVYYLEWRVMYRQHSTN